MKKLIAIDFDGTIVGHNFPDIGDPIPYAEEALRFLHEKGFKIILWTMRSNTNEGAYLSEAIDHVEVNFAVPLWAANTNPTQKSWTTSPKAYAPVYIDDAALGCPMLPEPINDRPAVDWMEVMKQLGDKWEELRDWSNHFPSIKETIKEGGRYCSKCGEFLGMTCDPFGRSNCGSGCFPDPS